MVNSRRHDHRGWRAWTTTVERTVTAPERDTRRVGHAGLLLAVVAACSVGPLAQTSGGGQEPAPMPQPARNGVAQRLGPSDEVLMLRHQRLKKGAHELYYRASLFGVWPWFERLGARMSGQWQVVYPEGGGNPDFDEGYRLARYASFEHWKHTRGALSAALGGNGPNRERSNQALRTRGEYGLGSAGGYFLQGVTATTRPLFLPAVDEVYERIDASVPDPGDGVIAVRNDVERPGVETLALRYTRIRKGSFDDIVRATVAQVWPYEEKLGVRPVGQWKVVYPEAPRRTEESPDYDEMITLNRYASYEHYQATRPGQAVLSGGNGPDWQAWRRASEAEVERTLETTTEFLQGFTHTSSPSYQPGVPERYRLP